MRDGELGALAAACAKCGTCRSVCTLYPERKAESAVARGKIALVEAGLSGADRDGAALREALADCLLCGRCERSCPGGVAVEDIVAGGRAALAEALGFPAWMRILHGEVLPSARRREAARAAVRVAQKFLARVPAASGLRYRFPAAGVLAGRTLPAVPARGFTASLGPDEARRGDAVLFVGCVFDHLLPEVGRAAYETLSAAGPVAVSRDAACCGLPALAAGDRAAAARCAEGNVRRLAAAGEGPVVFPCGSCLHTFRRHLLALVPPGHPLREDAERVVARSVDYAGHLLASGALARLPDPPAAAPGSVGYHDPCHLAGSPGKGQEAREVLRRAAGTGFREMAGADLCCGHGGSFNVRDYPTSVGIGERKILLAAGGGTAVVATACSGCLLQLSDAAARAAPSLRVVHLAQVVAAARSAR